MSKQQKKQSQPLNWHQITMWYEFKETTLYAVKETYMEFESNTCVTISTSINNMRIKPIIFKTISLGNFLEDKCNVKLYKKTN